MLNILLASSILLGASNPNWGEVYQHVKKGKSVSLALDITQVDTIFFSVVLTDEVNGKMVEYPIASSAFYGTTNSVFLYDITSTLLKFKNGPSTKAKIVVKGAKLNSVEIRLHE
jgi:hypothetical protein